MRVLYDRGWRAAAKCLEKMGYTKKDRTGEVVVPALFEKPGCETLYLVRPILDDLYRYSTVTEGVAAECGLIDVDGSELLVFFYAEGSKVPRNNRWVPRTWRSRPRLGYSIRDAAEHAGVTFSAVKSATYRPAPTQLVPTQYVGGQRVVMFDESSLAKWMARRRVGAPRSANFRKRTQLGMSDKGRLLGIIRGEIERGDDALLGRLAAAIEPLNGRSAQEIVVAVASPAGLDYAMGLADKLERSALIDIAAID